MKLSSLPAALAPVGISLSVSALLFLPELSAQTFTAVTEPVGFTKVTIPAATADTTRRVLAVPYQRPGAFQSSVTNVGANTLTLANANWTASQFLGIPHFVAVRKGSQAGRYFRVTAHTANTLTVDPGTGSLPALVAVNDSAEIFPAHTLGSLFGTAAVPFKTGPDENSADLVRLRSAAGWVNYFHDGAGWKTSGNGSSQNETVIRPDQALFIVARGTSALTLQLAGEVNPTRQRTTVPGNGEALVGNRFPVGTTLNALQLQTLTGWTAGEAASVADNVMIWSGTSWEIYYYNAGNWEQVGSFSNANNTPIPATGGVLIRRKAGASGAEQQLPSDPPFLSQ